MLVLIISEGSQHFFFNLALRFHLTFQAPVVQKLDSAIHRINHYPTFSVVNDPFTAETDPLAREIDVVCVTGLSRDKFTTGNIHGYIRKNKETVHDI